MIRDENRAGRESTDADEMSVIRHNPTAGRPTVSNGTVTDNAEEEIMPIATLDVQTTAHSTKRRYFAPMTSADAVIAAIDGRRPGLKLGKKLLLLFFCQGHHLAHSDDPLFPEALYATDHGVTLEDALGEAPSINDEQGLNTIGYVISRYGALSPADLRTLVQASTPWQLAMKSTSSPRIEWAWLRDWFRRPDETDDPDDERPNRAEMAAAATFWRNREGR